MLMTNKEQNSHPSRELNRKKTTNRAHFNYMLIKEVQIQEQGELNDKYSYIKKKADSSRISIELMFIIQMLKIRQ